VTDRAAETAVARLLAVEADVRPAEFALTGETCTLGRADGCDLVVDRPTVSRLHARVVREGPRFLLHDVASANGTFVNGRRLAGPHLLADRDQIGLGSPAPLLRFADPDPTVMPSGRLRYDEGAMRFLLGGRPLELSPNELRLLRFLFQRAGSVCPRERCAEAVWGPDFAPGLDAEALDRLVSNLRGKLRRADPTTDLIQTRPGLGYVLEP
jgi:DNA-binding response OmpR family regulator